LPWHAAWLQHRKGIDNGDGRTGAGTDRENG
jgi:hypothetical protein